MSFTLARVIQTVDSHTEGNPTRVIVGGVATPPGKSVPEKRDWLRDNNDALRRLLNFEPRGSGMMCSVLLMPPLDDRADFAVIIMEQDAYVPMCGHCIIGTATTVVACARSGFTVDVITEGGWASTTRLPAKTTSAGLRARSSTPRMSNCQVPSGAPSGSV